MRLTLLFSLLFYFLSASSQDSIPLTLFDKLHGEEKIVLRISYPFDSLYKTNNGEIDATISILFDNTVYLQDAPLTLNIRGKFRRMKCSMPPLLLNFKKATLRELGLRPTDEIKLVTHCMEGPEAPLNLEEERLVYQMYESVTPISYRTVWVDVEYHNSLGKDIIKSVGFLIEPDKVLSRRLGVDEKKLFNISQDSIDFASYANAVAFNFLIGNRDWSIVSSRNAKLFYQPTLGKYIVIPYDFDYSNIVGATYRREALSKTMTHPFDRVYEGEYFKGNAAEILKSFYVFEKTIIEAVKAANNPMNAERRKKICKYLGSWFDMIHKSKLTELGYGTICPYDGSF